MRYAAVIGDRALPSAVTVLLAGALVGGLSAVAAAPAAADPLPGPDTLARAVTVRPERAQPGDRVQVVVHNCGHGASARSSAFAASITLSPRTDDDPPSGWAVIGTNAVAGRYPVYVDCTGEGLAQGAVEVGGAVQDRYAPTSPVPKGGAATGDGSSVGGKYRLEVYAGLALAAAGAAVLVVRRPDPAGNRLRGRSGSSPGRTGGPPCPAGTARTRRPRWTRRGRRSPTRDR